MPWLPLPDWLQDVLPWLGLASVLMFVATPLLVCWLVARMPADYFVGTRRKRRRFRHPALHAAAVVVKNVVGTVLVAAGIAMLVLPGQGLLTLLVGVALLDIPGKYAIERRLVQRPAIRRALNWIRRKSGTTPLATEQPENAAPTD